MNNPRLVRVKNELGYFRGWEQSDSQTSQTYVIVEVNLYFEKEVL